MDCIFALTLKLRRVFRTAMRRLFFQLAAYDRVADRLDSVQVVNAARRVALDICVTENGRCIRALVKQDEGSMDKYNVQRCGNEALYAVMMAFAWELSYPCPTMAIAGTCRQPQQMELVRIERHSTRTLIC